MTTQQRPGRATPIALRRFVLLIALTAPLASPAFAATGGSASGAGAGEAVVVAPIVLSHVTGSALSFGSFTTGTGGTVAVDAAGASTLTGDVGTVPGSTASADQFTVAGEANAAFSIASTAGTVSDGSTTMAFTTTPSLLSAALNAGGTASFTVGGDLTVLGSEPAGAYTGAYDVTVAYN